MKFKIRKLLIGLVAVSLLVGLSFVIWAENPLGPEEKALSALESDGQVAVMQTDVITLYPLEVEPEIGFIFYPGGRVDERSYAPVLRQIAAEGFLVVLVPMPLNLAVFAPDRAGSVIAAYPSIERWAVGGHSLGGAMAANFIYMHPDFADALVLWASYPAESNNLSNSDAQVLSIYGTLDMAGMEKFDTTRTLLPMDTTWVVIDGGNHAQFGDYGFQPGDNTASISAAVQQEQVVNATIAFLAGLAKHPALFMREMETFIAEGIE